MTEKLQKVLARAGLGSRREIEDWIAAGRVSVNAVRATLGDRVVGREVIRVDGHIVPLRKLAGTRRRVLLYNKPEGQICSRADPEGRPTVYDRLPYTGGSRWNSIGRLDYNTMGLLILTTDGELVHRLTHPSYGLEREYAVRVLGEVTDETLKQLREGVPLEDGPARFLKISDRGGEGANHWYHVVLEEGRNREVRRLFEAVGVEVSRLIRVRYGPIALPRGLHRGRWEELGPQAVWDLARAVGLDEKPEVRDPDQRGGPGSGPQRGRRAHQHEPRAGRPRREGGNRDSREASRRGGPNGRDEGWSEAAGGRGGSDDRWRGPRRNERGESAGDQAGERAGGNARRGPRGDSGGRPERSRGAAGRGAWPDSARSGERYPASGGDHRQQDDRQAGRNDRQQRRGEAPAEHSNSPWRSRDGSGRSGEGRRSPDAVRGKNGRRGAGHNETAERGRSDRPWARDNAGGTRSRGGPAGADARRHHDDREPGSDSRRSPPATGSADGSADNSRDGKGPWKKADSRSTAWPTKSARSSRRDGGGSEHPPRGDKPRE